MRLIMMILFPFVGIYMLFQSLGNILQIVETENWKQTVAFVESIEIERIEKSRGDRFYPIIKFSYEIDGTPYTGDRLTFESGMVYQSESEAKYIAESYLNNEDKSKISIYYDPKNPKFSIISRGNKNSEYPLVFYGILFLTIGLIMNSKFISKTIKTATNSKGDK